MRNKPSSLLQKTYDECYLICSTAVYYEGQNNEAEALRSWRAALDQIYYHNAYLVTPNYRPKSETEKALQGSLRDMEMQCKERVDLLEALHQSRIESSASSEDIVGVPSTIGAANGQRRPGESEDSERGYIGQGTIPAINYPDLSKPVPPLPQRPKTLSKKSSAVEIPTERQPSMSSISRLGILPSAPAPKKNGSRSPSPEKNRGLLMTLRPGKDGKRPSKAQRGSALQSKKPADASKAAVQAWGSISRLGGERPGLQNANSSRNSIATYSARKDSYASTATRTESDSWPNTLDERRLSSNYLELPDPSDFISSKPELSNGIERPNSWAPANPGLDHNSDFPAPLRFPRRASDDLLYSENPSIPPLPPPHRSSENSFHQQNFRKTSPTRTSQAESESRPSFMSKYPPRNPRRTIEPTLRDSWSVNDDKQPLRASRQRSPQRRPRLSNIISNVQRKPVGSPSNSRESRGDARAESSLSEEEGRYKALENRRKVPVKQSERLVNAEGLSTPSSEDPGSPIGEVSAWQTRVDYLVKNLPKGVDEAAAKQIFNEIVVQGDEVHWDDVAGLDIAKNALKEAVVYPFLRPDLFMGLREPARGMLLFGPPGTGKTMLARAVATESKSTFFSISASSLTSKYLGESEKLVRALFSLAKALAPSIIFVDEIDSLLSSRSGSGEHEATRRIKTEFLIQWSDLARAAAGREQSEKERERGDASRVLVLAATNLPWAIDEAARRRFVRRQYIPLPEGHVRAKQLRTLLGHQKHDLSSEDIDKLVDLTDGTFIHYYDKASTNSLSSLPGFSGSDITALAKDAAMGPLRSLGEALLHMTMDEIRPIQFADFQASLVNIRPSVSPEGLKEFEEWAGKFGERGG
ncbi:MAG: hypothetical protein M1829_006919 [Trizodia sp. TS-e1964]|nr:MAG: hypothetical protein M1829_006919 [Trizodia sp. TS-e1964]